MRCPGYLPFDRLLLKIYKYLFDLLSKQQFSNDLIMLGNFLDGGPRGLDLFDGVFVDSDSHDEWDNWLALVCFAWRWQRL